jgi:hypothetical protein
MRTIEAVKDAVQDILKGVEADAIVSSLQTLLDSKRHSAPPTEYLFFGPADALLARMQAASGPKGLPKTADQLVAWLKVHYFRHPNKKLFRDAYITIELTPSWAGRKCTLIRLERAPRPPKEYPLVVF